jgi:hypothetical protein
MALPPTNSTPLVDSLRDQQHIYENNQHEILDTTISDSIVGHLFKVLKSLRLGGDPIKISAPTFFLKPISFLEMQANYTRPIIDLISPSINTVSQSQCMLIVLKWLIAGWCQTPQQTLCGLKPYNPILGEQFHCEWDSGESITEFHAEQVSHHPPICCCIMINRKHQIVFRSGGQMTAHFWGNSIDAILKDSYFEMDFIARGEKYIINMPALTAHGLIFGSSGVCHTGKASISCAQSGLSCDVTFSKNNHLSAIMHDVNRTNLYTIEGDLTGILYITDHSKISSSEHSWSFFRRYESTIPKEVFVDINELKKSALLKKTAMLVDQAENESRRVWHSVTYALKSGDLEGAQQHKDDIEQKQRYLKSQETYTDFHPVLFIQNNNQYLYHEFV